MAGYRVPARYICTRLTAPVSQTGAVLFLTPVQGDVRCKVRSMSSVNGLLIDPMKVKAANYQTSN